MFAPLLTSRGGFQHVVFADEIRGARRAVNLAPQQDIAPDTPDALADDEREFFVWLLSRFGLDAGVYRAETLARRLSACLRILRVDTVVEARNLLEAQPWLLQPAIDAVLIGVTSFFRDRAVFDALREQVLPVMCGRRQELRVWSAGCSDGAELYSVAMLLDQCERLPSSHLLGTDCRPRAIRAAADGWYDHAAVRPLARDLQERYFTPGEKGMRICSTLRVRLRWRAADVLYTTDTGYWDIILCRNLAMYLSGAAMTQLWRQMYEALRPGGVLVLGKAERPTGGLFTPILPCIFRRDPR